MKVKHIVILVSLFIIGACLLFYFTAKGNGEALSAMTELTPHNAVIVIDAGHGGMDGGACAADGTPEKDINLSIALKLDEMLRAAGFKTVVTRKTDVSIHDGTAKTVRQQKVSDIKNRLAIVENMENAIFVSIHQNHYSKSNSKGSQVFYSKNNPSSQTLALSIQNTIAETLQPDNSRRIKQSGTEIYLLYHATRPAVMVECGFLSNYEETQMLKRDDYQNQLAFAIMGGIVRFFGDANIL
ncbi:MAG: N-acetylmuramoyl-L-alanine amidase [Oscillospiraceae bacterium]|nr:N-acetylmuramoyl-L-alanine amidase [Oscillospiraceae bacterium]